MLFENKIRLDILQSDMYVLKHVHIHVGVGQGIIGVWPSIGNWSVAMLYVWGCMVRSEGLL